MLSGDSLNRVALVQPSGSGSEPSQRLEPAGSFPTEVLVLLLGHNVGGQGFLKAVQRQGCRTSDPHRGAVEEDTDLQQWAVRAWRYSPSSMHARPMSRLVFTQTAFPASH